jgi:hypothetical protein
MRWFMRVTKPGTRGLQLRITERMYRPKRGRLSDRSD